MTLFLLAISVCIVVAIVTLSVTRRRADYRGRSFYRKFYTTTGFNLIVFGWRVCGKTVSTIIARLIGLGYALTHPATVRAIRSNIVLLEPRCASYPAACRVLMNMSENLAAYGQLASINPDEVMNLLGAREGFEHLKQAHAEGNGCLLVTGHLGFFELGGVIMSRLGFPTTALTIDEPTPELTAWRAAFRNKWGVETIVIGDDSFSAVEIARILHKGTFVAMLADRPYNGKAIPVTLPNGRILFSTGPVILSLLAKCPIIPVGVVRQPDGKFRIQAGKMIRTSWLPEGKEETLAHYTRLLAGELLPMFMKNPEQWFHFSPLGLEVTKPATTNY